MYIASLPTYVHLSELVQLQTLTSSYTSSRECEVLHIIYNKKEDVHKHIHTHVRMYISMYLSVQ